MAGDTYPIEIEESDGTRRTVHIRTAPPGTPIPPFAVDQLRQRGLLEGDELTEVWDRLVRDRELGHLLLIRHGVRLGRDGDRLYVRRESYQPGEVSL